MRRFLKTLAIAAVLTGGGSLARAEPATLTITSGAQSVQLDAAALGKLRQDVVETKTPWTAGSTRFSGPAFTDLLSEAGFAGETVTAVSADGRSVAIPRARLTSDGAILALGVNDKPLAAYKGPFWIVFPYDRSPELGDKQHQDWSLWGVTKLTVK